MAAATYYEPRWDLQGNRKEGVPVRLAPGYYHAHLEATNSGNLRECYGCHRLIQRTETYHLVAALYLTPQPSGDIVRDYVYGGTIQAAHAPLCESCWSEL